MSAELKKPSLENSGTPYWFFCFFGENSARFKLPCGSHQTPALNQEKDKDGREGKVETATFKESALRVLMTQCQGEEQNNNAWR
jgi:hypothetical protein